MRASLLAALVFAVAVSGCGNSGTSASNQAAERVIEQAAQQQGIEADVQITDEGASFSMNASSERGAETIQSGENLPLPENLPKDIPLPDALKVTMINTAATNEVFNIQATNKLSVDELVQFYKTQAPARGWKEVSASALAGVMASLEYEKEDRVLRVIVNNGNGWSMLTLNTERN